MTKPECSRVSVLLAVVDRWIFVATGGIGGQIILTVSVCRSFNPSCTISRQGRMMTHAVSREVFSYFLGIVSIGDFFFWWTEENHSWTPELNRYCWTPWYAYSN